MILKELIKKLQALPPEFHALKVVQPGVNEGGLAPNMWDDIIDVAAVAITPLDYTTFRGTYESAVAGTPPNAIAIGWTD